jgi:hypothetical protein
VRETFVHRWRTQRHTGFVLPLSLTVLLTLGYSRDEQGTLAMRIASIEASLPELRAVADVRQLIVVAQAVQQILQWLRKQRHIGRFPACGYISPASSSLSSSLAGAASGAASGAAAPRSPAASRTAADSEASDGASDGGAHSDGSDGRALSGLASHGASKPARSSSRIQILRAACASAERNWALELWRCVGSSFASDSTRRILTCH